MDQSARSAMAAKAQTLYRPFPGSAASAPPAATEAGMAILVAGTEASAGAGCFIPAGVGGGGEQQLSSDELVL
jgi:hypothetical protein